MKNLRKLGLAALLMFMLALSTFAGQVDTPPCPSPEPGQVDTPPCSVAPGDINAPGVTGPSDLAIVTAPNNETSFTEFATDVLLNFLSVY